MAQNRIRFGSSYIELGSSQDFPFSLNIGIADIADITKRRGIYSQNFKVPAVQQNNEAFKSLWQDQIDGDSIAGIVYGKNTASFEQDGIIWDKGYAKVSAALKNSLPQEYEVNYLGGNMDWITLVGDKKLNELGNQATAIFDKDSVLAAASGSLDWTYPLINYGGWVSGVEPLSATGVPHGVSTRDFRPAFRVSALVEQIFEDAGYSIESNWIKSAEATGVVYLAGTFAVGENLVPNATLSNVTGDTITGVQPDNQYYYFGDGIEANDYFNIYGTAITTGITPFGIASMSGVYDCVPIQIPVNGQYLVDVSYAVSYPSTNALDPLQVRWEFRDIATNTQAASGTMEVNRDTGLSAYIASASADLEASKTYAFGIDIANFGGGRNASLLQHQLRIRRKLEITLNDEFLPYQTLGEEKQIDFLTTIAKTYNLFIDANSGKRSVCIEPRNDWTGADGTQYTGYYRGIENAVDWSDKLDVQEGIQLKYLTEYKDELEFTYEGLEDYFPERWEEAYGYKPYRELYEFPQNYEEGRTQVKHPYAPTINKYEDGKINGGIVSFVQMPFIWDDSPENREINRDVSQRLFVYEWDNENDYLLRPREWRYYNDNAVALSSSVDPVNSYELTGNFTGYTFVPKAWQVNYDDTSKFQLTWASYGDGEGLAQRFYSETVTDLRNRQLYEASFRLRPSDILPFLQCEGFRNPVHIDGVYYRVNKIINYQPQIEASTKVQLIKITPRSFVDFGTEQINELLEIDSSPQGVVSGFVPLPAETYERNVLPYGNGNGGIEWREFDNIGFIDYNDTTGDQDLLDDTWTDVPNNGLGEFSNTDYKPYLVNELMDTDTGYLNFTELPLGSQVIVRNDFTITPNTNNSLLEVRYLLGTGAGQYALNFWSERLDNGSGKPYQRVLTLPIYIGNLNTRNNPGILQVRLSTVGVLNNTGSYINVIKR